MKIIESASENFRPVAVPVVRPALGDAPAPVYVNRLYLKYYEKSI